MKIRLILASVICATAFVAGTQAQPKKEEHTPLGEQMEKINGAYGKIRRQAPDATKNADSLAQVAIIKEAAEASLKLEPAKLASIPADQQAKFKADYQASMKTFIADAEKLEAALKAGKNEEAVALVQTLNTAKMAGHKEFKASAKK